jgi:hypothetical protein
MEFRRGGEVRAAGHQGGSGRVNAIHKSQTFPLVTSFASGCLADSLSSDYDSLRWKAKNRR